MPCGVRNGCQERINIIHGLNTRHNLALQRILTDTGEFASCWSCVRVRTPSWCASKSSLHFEQSSHTWSCAESAERKSPLVFFACLVPCGRTGEVAIRSTRLEQNVSNSMIEDACTLHSFLIVCTANLIRIRLG